MSSFAQYYIKYRHEFAPYDCEKRQDNEFAAFAPTTLPIALTALRRKADSDTEISRNCSWMVAICQNCRWKG